MKAQDIKERLQKAQETVAKKEKTLDKYYKKAEKIRKEIASHGWDEKAGRYQKEDTPEHHDCYWMFCDLDDQLEGIKRTQEAIAEKKALVAKYEVQLQEAEEKENLIERTFPAVLKDFQNEVVRFWDKWDMNRKESLKKEYDKMRAENAVKAYKEFIKKYTYTTYKFMVYTTAEEIHRDNVKASERLLINLWNRVKEITGEATDWSDLHLTNGNEWEGCVVNGLVIGTDGTARVETIGAGGWNIQRFHYRTLVHRV